MGRGDKDFVEENGETGVYRTKDGKQVFKSMLSGTIQLLKMVKDINQEQERGVVVCVQHAWEPERRKNVFLRTKCFEKVANLMSELNKLDLPLFTHSLTNGDLVSFLNYLLKKTKLANGTIPKAYYMQHLGIQDDGACILSNSVVVKDGAILPQEQHSFYMPNTNLLPTPEFRGPLDNGYHLKRLYRLALDMYGWDVFMDFMRTGGAALKGLHYKSLMERHGRVGITVVEGSFNTGKTLSAKLALSGSGLSKSGLISSISYAGQRKLLSNFALPLCFNDIKDAKLVEQVAMAAFEHGSITNCREDLTYCTAPFIVCNHELVVALERKMSPWELSRIAFASFNVSLPTVSNENRQALDKAMKDANASIWLLIGAKEEIVSCKGLQSVMDKMDFLPSNSWNERLIHVYALDIWCAHVFSRLIGNPVSTDALVDHLRKTTLKEIMRFQGFKEPFREPLTTLEKLIGHAIRIMTTAELKELLSITTHCFDGSQKTDAVCIRIGPFLHEFCPFEKGKFQSSLRSAGPSMYGTSKQRFNGKLHDCTLINMSVFHHELVTRLKEALGPTRLQDAELVTDDDVDMDDSAVAGSQSSPGQVEEKDGNPTPLGSQSSPGQVEEKDGNPTPLGASAAVKRKREAVDDKPGTIKEPKTVGMNKCVKP